MSDQKTVRPLLMTTRRFGKAGVLLWPLWLLFCSLVPAFGQGYFVIGQIEIEGNQWTRDYIIERELDFLPGDTVWLHKMIPRMEENRSRLLDTGLFNGVEINLSRWDTDHHSADIHIQLVENWFWYPSPIIELGDRSFNEWIYQHNANLKRINLGLRFMHINMSGNQDRLKLNFNLGYTQKYELDYSFPYLNRERTLGAYYNILYVTHKNIAFETRENKLNFVGLENENLLTRFRTSVGIHYRKGKEQYHTLLFEYHQQMIHDTVSQWLNPDYFNHGLDRIRHFRIYYTYLYTNVDKKIYPTFGQRFLFTAQKDGGFVFSDLNYLQLTAGYEKVFRLHPNFSSGFRLKGRKTLNLGSEIPYSYLNGMGFYDDVLSGYQLYVIDGQDFAYLKSTQKLKVLDLAYNFGRFMPLKQFRVFPLQVYLGLHTDLGYVKEARFASINPFNNRPLFGGALSLDLIVYHNYFISVEFTLNHLGERGVFLQGTNTFQ